MGGSHEVFNMLDENPELLANLRRNTQRFRSKMTAAGFNILGHEDCPIAPVYLEDARLASEFSEEMMKQGIYVIGFSFPVVPKGKARIRVQLSGAHSEEQIDRAVDGFIAVGKAKGVI